MAYSTQTVVSDGSLSTLDITIGYQERSDIRVFFDDVEDAYGWDWVGASHRTIAFDTDIPEGVVVRVQRFTDLDDPRHIFGMRAQGGSAAFTARSMDENFEQFIYIAQEARETAETLTDKMLDRMDAVELEANAATSRSEEALDRATTALAQSNTALIDSAQAVSDASAALSGVAGAEAAAIAATAAAQAATEAAQEATAAINIAPDLADAVDPAKGAHMVGFDGGKLDAVLEDLVQFADYDAVRNYAGRGRTGRVRMRALWGDFAIDPDDSSTSDDNGTVLVDALGRRWKRQNVDEVHLRWFQPVGTGEVSDHLPIQRAIDASVRLGVPAKFHAAKFGISTTVTTSGVPVKIDANGATFIQLSTQRMFYFTGAWDGTSYISDISLDANGRSVVTLAGSDPMPDWTTGDVVKVVSEAPLAMFPTNAKKGEHQVVYSVDPNNRTVTLMSELADTYSPDDSARIGKMMPCSVVFKNFIFDVVPGKTSTGSWNPQDLMRLFSINGGYISGASNFAYGTQTVLWGCYNVTVQDYTVRGGMNDDDDGSGYLSYGLSINFSSHCRVLNAQFSRLRHGIVCISSDSSSVGSMREALGTYGPCDGNVISGCTAMFCSNTGFDTHHGVKNTRWTNCHTMYGRRSGFSNRGVNTVMSGCTSTEDANGLTNFLQSGYVDTATPPSIYVLGCTFIDPRNSAVYSFRGSGNINIVGGGVQITRTRTRTQPLYRFADAVDVFISGGHQLHINASLSSTMPCVVGFNGIGNQRLSIDGWYVDCRGMNNHNNKSFIVNSGEGSGSTQLHLRNMTVFTTSASSRWSYVFGGALSTASRIYMAEFRNFVRFHETQTNADLGNRLYGPVTFDAATAPVGNLFN